MATCIQCGRELPVYTDGRQIEKCPECQVREQIQQQQALKAKRPNTLQMAKVFPVTATIVALNLAIYALCALASYRLRMGSPMEFDTRLLLKWGADYGPLTLDRQFWRVLTSMFLHGGLIHVAANMWCYWDFGRIAERVYGRYRYLTIYLLTGLASSISSLAIHPNTVSVGASGAIFGVVGALVFPFYRKRVTLPPPVMKAMMRSLVVFILVNLAIGQAIPFIDNAAHVGGLLAGLVLGAIITQIATSGEAMEQVFWKIAVGSAMVLAFAFVGVQHQHRVEILPGRSTLALDAGNQALAASLAQKAVAENPKDPMAHVAMGDVYWEKRQFAEAASSYETAHSMQPNNAYVAGQLGSAYVALGKWKEAEPLLRQALKDDSEDAALLLNLGTTLAALNHFDEALQHLHQAAEKDPKSAKTQYVIGSVLVDQKLYPQALAAFREAVRLEPQNAEYQKTLAGVEAQVDSK